MSLKVSFSPFLNIKAFKQLSFTSFHFKPSRNDDFTLINFKWL